MPQPRPDLLGVDEQVTRLRDTFFERIVYSAEVTLHTAESRISSGELQEDADVAEAVSTLRTALAEARAHWDHPRIGQLRMATWELARLLSEVGV